MKKTGYGAHELPRPLQRWAQAGEERERRRRDKGWGRERGEKGDGLFEDDEGSFVLGTRERVGDEVEGDEWKVQEFRDGEMIDRSKRKQRGDTLVRVFEFDD